MLARIMKFRKTQGAAEVGLEFTEFIQYFGWEMFRNINAVF
jgi:hypothetical protein